MSLYKVNLKGGSGGEAGEISNEEWTTAQKAANQVDFVEGLPLNAENEVMEREKAYMERYPEMKEAHE